MTPVPAEPTLGAVAAAVLPAQPAPAPDPWANLRRHTSARIALGRAGSSLPTTEWLRFAADHAQARDAVHCALDVPAMQATLAAEGWPTLAVASQATDRAAYLRRPDLGRRLDEASAARLRAAATALPAPPDLVIVLGDGLSALAVHTQAPGLLAALRPALAGRFTLAPLVIATQARVALADAVGAILGARLALMLLGERPGLSAPDSLGAYLTYDPQPGCSDAQRNCVSNIRPEGLDSATAAHRITWLLTEAARRRLSGVALKDDSGTPLLPRTA